MALSKQAKAYQTLDPEQDFHPPTNLENRIVNWTLAQFEGKQVRLSASDQRKLLGFVVGKGRVVIEHRDGKWLAFNVISVCFGTDTAYSNVVDVATGETQN
ncbi:MAG: hypothetical protein RBJ76_13315 [Stenomitos frigidus ULC029]